MRGYHAAAAAAFLLTGCAAQNARAPASTPGLLAIRTTPPGADVEFPDGVRCTTPCTLNLAGRPESIATLTLLGYKPVQATVRVDPGGAVQPNPLDVTLAKEDPGGATVLPAGGAPSAPK